MIIKITAQHKGREIELLPLAEAAKTNGYSTSYIRFLADTGKITATKICGCWFVDKSLIKDSKSTTVQIA